jgi:predicted amidohydrolase
LKLKIGAAQMRVTPYVETNYRMIIMCLSLARRKRLDLVVFPECALSGYGPSHFTRPADIDHRAVEAKLRQLPDDIRRLGVAVVLGTSRQVGRNIYNMALWYDRRGRLAGAYSKPHLMDNEKRFYAPGRRLASCLTFKTVPMGMQICFDFRFPEPWRLLAQQGARLVVHLANGCDKKGVWKVPVWEAHLRSRAAENGCFVVSANAAGPHQVGASQIVDPDGLLLATGRLNTAELITAKLDLARATRRFFRARRTDLYMVVKK